MTTVKQALDATIDAMSDFIAGCDRMHVCVSAAADATYAQVTAATNSLGYATITGAGEFTKGAGTPSGRQIATPVKNGVAVTADGTATQVVLVNSGASSVRYITTCSSQALVSGNTVNFPSWTITVVDPT